MIFDEGLPRQGDAAPHSPDVTIVIPAKNEARRIERCLSQSLSVENDGQASTEQVLRRPAGLVSGGQVEEPLASLFVEMEGNGGSAGPIPA